MREIIWHIFSHAVIDSLWLLPFLFVTYLCMELLEHKAGDKVKGVIVKTGRAGPILGGLVGLANLLLVGFTRSVSNHMAMFVGFWMILAILSTYINIVVSETEALRAHSMGTVSGQDYVGRVD